jgi:hypothetical protein
MDNSEVVNQQATYFEKGPYLLLALPEWFAPLLPLNATSFLREWELMLDPIAAARGVARDLLKAEENWQVRDNFVLPSLETLALLRQLAQDEDIAAVMKASEGVLSTERRILLLRSLAENAEGRLALKNEAAPVLLALGVAATAYSPVAKNGQLLEEPLQGALKHREALLTKRRQEREAERTEAILSNFADELEELPGTDRRRDGPRPD